MAFGANAYGGYNTYKQVGVKTASQGKLVVMLYEGAISKEYLLSEGELNAFMVQLVSGLFSDVVLDIYNIFFDQYTKKEIAYIQDTLNKVKAD